MAAAITVLVDRSHGTHDGPFGTQYPEIPARVASILAALDRAGFAPEEAHLEPREEVKRLHAPEMLEYLETACAQIQPGGAIYPPVIPGSRAGRDASGHPHSQTYCFDLSTPLAPGTPTAAMAAAGLALEGARRVESGSKTVYALCRPPGHHTGRNFFGGFCYLNNAALAANALARGGQVAILDLDYHHGNGTQEIFYRRADVLYVSVHADPRYAYPGFSGFADEMGEGEGRGANFNFPLPDGTDDKTHLAILPKALECVSAFGPKYLVVSLGLDTAAGDPVGTWELSRGAFERMGAGVAELGLPTLIVQEGGYGLDRLGDDVVAFLGGMSDRKNA